MKRLKLGAIQQETLILTHHQIIIFLQGGTVVLDLFGILTDGIDGEHH